MDQTEEREKTTSLYRQLMDGVQKVLTTEDSARNVYNDAWVSNGNDKKGEEGERRDGQRGNMITPLSVIFDE